MKSALFGFVLGLAAIPVAALVVVKMGYAPVATASPPLPLEKWFARTAIHARIDKEAPGNSPVVADVTNLVAGAKIYRQQCAVCHGLPDQQPTPTAKGMFPPPPQLFRHTVTDDPVGETYWKVANGIRLTGMPGYRGSLSDEQMWQVSQMLAHADKLPTEATVPLQQTVP